MESRSNRNKKLQIENKRKKKEKRKEKRKKSKTKFRAITIIIILLIIIYGLFIEPNLLKVNEIKIENKNIPESFNGIKIVQFSDLHYGSTINKNNINKIVNKINLLKPDIVIFTGDLIEENVNITKDDTKILTNSLNEINYTIGKYAVIGNHDFYKKEYNNIMYDANFNILKNSYDTIYNKDNNPILIYGVDDTLYGSPNIEKINNKSIRDIPYKILIMHEPDYIEKIINKYDINLALAGHSHNGQIKIPYIRPIYTPIGAKKYYNNHYTINDTQLYVSGGIGTNTIDFRLGCTPSINLFRLNSK